MAQQRTFKIDNLKFFDGDGREILMKKQYSLSWEIVPAEQMFSAFIKNPRGHFELYPDNNIPFYEETNRTLKTDVAENMTYVIVLESNTAVESQVVFYINGTEKPLSSLTQSQKTTAGFSEQNVTLEDSTEITIIQFTYSFANKLGISSFYVTKTDSDVHAQVLERSNILDVIVDEPGQIRKKTTFKLKQADKNQIADYKNPDKAFYESFKDIENVDSEYGDVVLDDIFDIIFFAYRYCDNDYVNRPVWDNTINWEYSSNKLVVNIFNGEQEAYEEYNLIDLLRWNSGSTISSLLPVTCYNDTRDFNDESLTISSTETDIYGISKEILSQVLITKSSFDDIIETATEFIKVQSTANYLMSYNVPATQFPYVKYIGTYYMEKVSTDFISSSTIIIAQENTDSTGKTTYDYPDIVYYEDDDTREEYRLHFRFQENSEMKFISTDETMSVVKRDDVFMFTGTEKKEDRSRVVKTGSGENYWMRGEDTMMNFTVGFQTSEEGCYENVMGIFIRNVETDEDFLIGAIRFLTEAESEDERYRTLFTNFGIPDPIKYPNIFKSQDPEENAVDWRVVNEKSKELFLYYDQIFPYVGTYKALFNAIKYLGYQDLVFKEWYRVKDHNDKNRYIAVQSYDTSTGTPIPNALKNYGIDYEQYERYRKLNRLSMTYHMQRITDEYEEQLYPNKDKSKTDAEKKANKYYNSKEIPAIENVYEYRTSEVLAKLYSVKNWLERYILGVNCYISDINAEGIVLERVKTTGYVTSHEFKDIQIEGYFTPKCKQVTPFMDSSTVIQCSLNEFGSATFGTYKDFQFDRFIRANKNNTEITATVGDKTITVYDSAPFGALTVADEYDFTLRLDNAESGSLYEFTDSSYIDNPIVVNDGEIKFWDDSRLVSKLDAGKLPTICIKKGNLRFNKGDWNTIDNTDTNIKWAIKTVTDTSSVLNENGEYATGNTFTLMTDIENTEDDGRPVIRAKGGIMLSPDYSNGRKPSLIYTTNNKWDVPVFVIKDYIITNQYKPDVYDTTSSYNYKASDYFNNYDTEFVVDIILGDIKFSNTNMAVQKYCTGAEIVFSEPNQEDYGEQVININYTYQSERQRIYKFNKSVVQSSYYSIKELYDSLDSGVTLNTKVDVPVNRLGDYSVTVRAYDPWNSVYVKKSDDICRVMTKRVSIDVIKNSGDSENSTDFYRQNIHIPEIYAIDKTEIETKATENPEVKFPHIYKIYGTQHVEDDSTITYDNIGYALDTPKANDYILLSNMTEKVDSFEIQGQTAVFNMSIFNTQKQNIYIPDGLINIVLFDVQTQEIIAALDEPVRITALTVPTETAGGVLKTALTSDLQTLYNDYKSKINDKELTTFLYIIGATEFILPENDKIQFEQTIDSSGNIERRTYIQFNVSTNEDENISDRHFNPDTVVKLEVNATDSDTELFTNQTAYRVLDISTRVQKNASTGLDEYVRSYVIDGIIDPEFIAMPHNVNIYHQTETITGDDSKKAYVYRHPEIEASLRPLHSQPVCYMLRANSDAAENVYVYGDYEYYAMNTTVPYNSKQLLFDSYFDDSYDVAFLKFDPADAKNIWNTEIESDTVLYRYTDFPVTVHQNQNVIVQPNIPYADRTADNMDVRKIIEYEAGKESKSFKTKWVWKSYVLEDKENWREYQYTEGKTVIFEATNEVLFVRPKYLGPQSIELYCTDKYGNIFKNNSGGNVCVDDMLNTSDMKEIIDDSHTILKDGINNKVQVYFTLSGITDSTIKALYDAITVPGNYCTITRNNETNELVFTNGTTVNSISASSEMLINHLGFGIHDKGFIIGTTPEPQQYSLVAFDVDCPNCDETEPLEINQEQCIAICRDCNIKYDISNYKGLAFDNENTDYKHLYRYQTSLVYDEENDFYIVTIKNL